MRLTVNDLHFSYASSPVLNGIDFCLDKTEFMCVVGPNGSGKSTLVKCIDSLLKPCRGNILLNGKDLQNISHREIARNISYVPQTDKQLFSATVFDTVLMGRKPYSSWKSSEEDLDITIDTLSMMRLSDIAMKEYNHLSGGQQQRVLIARALAQKPKLLLLDEPTSALDIAHQLEVMEIISQTVAGQKISALMVIHDLNLASRYATTTAMLSRGTIFAFGKASDVFTSDNIAVVYGVETVISSNSGTLAIVPVKRVDNG